MKQIKKFVMVVIMILGIGMTSACKDQGLPEVESESEQVTDTKGGMYGYDSPVNIKVGLSYAVDLSWVGDESPKDNAWMDLYREHNIFPEVLYAVDESQAESRLAAAVMSGDYPDILEGDIQEYKNWADNGVTADITEAYENYASEELKRYMLSDGGKGMEMLTIDGKLYGLPRIESPFEQVSIMFIRRDWLDKLNLKIPTTMEELKAVAHAFTYDDPDGNGADDTYGMAIDGINIVNNTVGDCSPIFAAYGVYLGNDTMAFVEEEGGTPVWGGANVSGMKKALLFLQELYLDGAICKDAVTMDSNAVFEDAGRGRCGIWFGPIWGGMIPASNSAKIDRDACVIAAPVPEGLGKGSVKAYIPANVRGVFCVSSQCENPEVLIKLMNLSVQKISYPETAEEYLKYSGDNENYTGAKTSLLYLQDTQNYESYKKIKSAMETGDDSGLNLLQQMDKGKINTFLEATERGELDPEDSQQSLGIAYYTVYGGTHSAWSVIDEMIQSDAFVYPVYNDLATDIMVERADSLKYSTVELIVKIMTGENVDLYDRFPDAWYSMGGHDILDEIIR